MAKRVKNEVMATLTIHRESEMTKQGKAKMAEWLRREADNLIDENRPDYASRFTARYRR